MRDVLTAQGNYKRGKKWPCNGSLSLKGNWVVPNQVFKISLKPLNCIWTTFILFFNKVCKVCNRNLGNINTIDKCLDRPWTPTLTDGNNNGFCTQCILIFVNRLYIYIYAGILNTITYMLCKHYKHTTICLGYVQSL